MRRVVNIGTVTYALCLYLTFFLYSPTISIHAIQEAMQLKDAELLEEYVDFSAVQNSIKAQLKSELILKAAEHESQTELSNPLLMAELAYATKMVEEFIELFLSRDGLSRLFAMSSDNRSGPIAVDAQRFVSSLRSERFIGQGDFEFKALRTIQVKGYDEHGKELKFILTFRYARWILTGVILDLRHSNSKNIMNFISNYQLNMKVEK